MTCCTASMQKSALLQKINEVSFAANDIHLFLDTHPCDKDAMAFFRDVSTQRDELLKEYARAYGPLTIDTVNNNDCNTWKWMEQPFPWEQEGGCR